MASGSASALRSSALAAEGIKAPIKEEVSAFQFDVKNEVENMENPTNPEVEALVEALQNDDAVIKEDEENIWIMH